MSNKAGKSANTQPVAAAVGNAGAITANTRRNGPSGRANWGVQTPELKRLHKILGVMHLAGAPHLEAALEDVAAKLTDAARSKAMERGSGTLASAVTNEGVSGSGIYLAARVRVAHPAANSYEFGRIYYYRRATTLATTSSRGKKRWFGAYIGNNRPGYRRKKGSMKGQERYDTRTAGGKGMRMRPIMGVLANYEGGFPPGAMQEVAPWALQRMSQGIEQEWTRLASEGMVRR